MGERSTHPISEAMQKRLSDVANAQTLDERFGSLTTATVTIHRERENAERASSALLKRVKENLGELQRAHEDLLVSNHEQSELLKAYTTYAEGIPYYESQIKNLLSQLQAAREKPNSADSTPAIEVRELHANLYDCRQANVKLQAELENARKERAEAKADLFMLKDEVKTLKGKLAKMATKPYVQPPSPSEVSRSSERSESTVTTGRAATADTIQEAHTAKSSQGSTSSSAKSFVTAASRE